MRGTIWIVTVGLWFGLSSGARGGEDAAKRYEARLGEIRTLLRDSCAAAGIPFERLGYTPAALATMRDPFRLERFDGHIGDPLAFKVHCDAVGAGFRDSVADPAAAFALLCRLNDVALGSIGRPGTPAEGDASGACLDALGLLWAAGGATLEGGEKDAAAAWVAAQPPELRGPLAAFLREAARSAAHFRAVFGPLEASPLRSRLEKNDAEWFDGEGGTFRQEAYDFCARLDVTSVLFAGRIALEASLALRDAVRAAFASEAGRARWVPARLATPLGDIVFAGPGNDAHPAGPTLLLVDVGGDDRYGAGAGGAAFGQFVSLCLDLGGDDRYEAGRGAAPSFGAAVCGAGFLFDEAGDDVYTADALAQGAAEFGAGLLFDGGGNDAYTLSDGGQGAARFGVAALLDAGGDDVYTCFQLAQGVGRVRGVGVLADGGGDDAYVARDDEIVSPSPQSRDHNSSLAQGVGFGRRADSTDGHSVSGGVGFLVDASGNDHYEGGVMAQAHGYWYGTGILVDFGGDDAYAAAWYGQSTSAHFGLSYLRDAGGNDRYETRISQSLGNGRDFSLSIFEDDEGDDAYVVPDRGAGCGNVNGIGIFLDLAGADRYAIRARGTLGVAILEAKAHLVRRQIPTIGLFVDARGKDAYVFEPEKHARAGIGDGSTWTQTGTRLEISLGRDLE